uniref:RNase H type-1 domain-containing protein n=1 Tax=Cannabis sativa TaxID=3483 RepID=A0A803QS40_CANSA
MKSTITLTDNESTILAITDDGVDTEVPEEFILIARVLTSKKVWLTTFQRQMAEHWDGRLPFLSKSRSLAKSLALISGEFLDVHDDSLNEGWEPFLRFRVKMDITKPLLRGRMITLPKIKDEFGLSSVMSGYQTIDQDYLHLPMIAIVLIFQRVTRLARNTLTVTLPSLRSTPKPQPRSFLLGESSNSTTETPAPYSSHNVPPVPVMSTGTSTNIHVIQPQIVPLFTPPSLNNISFSKSPDGSFNASTISPSLDYQAKNKGKTVLTSSSNQNSPIMLDVYTPDLVKKTLTHSDYCSSSVFSTYPPTTNSIHGKTQPFRPLPAGAVTSTSVSTISPATLHTTRTTLKGQENAHPNRTFKRQFDTNSMRQTFKRCRANQSEVVSSLSEEIPPIHYVSDASIDSTDAQDNFASLNFSSGLEVPRTGLKGGIMLLWKDVVDVTLISMNVNYFNCYMLCNDGPRWHLALVYGFPKTKNKKHTWTLIKRLHDVSPLDPWMVLVTHLDYYGSDHRAVYVDLNFSNQLENEKRRSRVEWLKSGDRNTEFFHAKATSRKSNSRISKLHNDNGQYVYSRDDIATVTQDFNTLFKALDEDNWALSHVLSTIPTTITYAHNDFLLQEFTQEDVISALKTMGVDKSPGQSIFTLAFYSGLPNAKVADYITNDHEWNLQSLQMDFFAVDIDKILTIPLSTTAPYDCWVWNHTVHGEYTVQSVVSMLRQFGVFQITLDFQAGSRMKDGDFIMYLSKLYTKYDMEKILCTMWFIWFDRNNILHDKLALQPAAIHAKSMAYLANFQQVHFVSITPTPLPSVAPHQPWQAPPQTRLKMNVDAAVSSTCNKLGFGAIIRDSNGHVRAALSEPAAGNFKAHEMEAKALYHSLNWAHNMHLQIDMVESDLLMVVTALNGLTSRNLDFNDLISDVKNQLSFLPNVCVSHVRRDANQAAHGLAKQALALDNDCVWYENISPTIFSVVVKDSLNL